MLRTLISKLKISNLKTPIAVTATGTSDKIDLQDFGSCALLVSVGAMAFSTDNKLDLIVAESDDGTVFTASADVVSAESASIAKALDATADQNSLYTFHYVGTKRYIQLNYTETGTVSVVLGVTALGGHPELMPPL